MAPTPSRPHRPLTKPGPGGHPGTTLHPAWPTLHPEGRLFGSVTPEPDPTLRPTQRSCHEPQPAALEHAPQKALDTKRPRSVRRSRRGRMLMHRYSAARCPNVPGHSARLQRCLHHERRRGRRRPRQGNGGRLSPLRFGAGALSRLYTQGTTSRVACAGGAQMYFTTITTESGSWTSPGLQRSYETAGRRYQLQRTRCQPGGLVAVRARPHLIAPTLHPIADRGIEQGGGRRAT